MGNQYRFRLSDMMPNSWFYKLKDNMARSSTTTRTSKRIHHHKIRTTPSIKEPPSTSSLTQPTQQQLYTPNRPSYYFPSRDQPEKPATSPAHPKASDTHFPLDPPRKSYKQSRRKPIKPPAKPIVSNPSPAIASFDDALCEHRLPPILTRPVKTAASAEKAHVEVLNKHMMLRRAQQGLHRIKVKHSSPKIELKRMQAVKERRAASSNGLAESFVVVKRSADPRRDFRESMVEMIVENDLRASRDLEELLACYLSLNSDEYHALIVKVFKEIWIDIAELRV